MDAIRVLNRQTGQIENEEVYGERALAFLYGKNWLGRCLRPLITRFSWFSAIYGWLQRRAGSRKKVLPFIETFGLDPTEFVKRPEEFLSFNDFFIRKLRREARPIEPSNRAVIPADGRYWFCPDTSQADGLLVKGRRYSLETLLSDLALARRYHGGALVMARLCPTDYHRFHFPCSGVPSRSQLIKGRWSSVNPIAIRKNLRIYTENKRMVTLHEAAQFGTIAMVEVGATNVGSIHQTYTPEEFVNKGAEKGYFSFGGSAMILLFERGRILFDADLLDASSRWIEIRCRVGESMGTSGVTNT